MRDHPLALAVRLDVIADVPKFSRQIRARERLDGDRHGRAFQVRAGVFLAYVEML